MLRVKFYDSPVESRFHSQTELTCVSVASLLFANGFPLGVPPKKKTVATPKLVNWLGTNTRSLHFIILLFNISIKCIYQQILQVVCEDGEIKETMYEDIESCSCEVCPHDTDTELPSMRQSLLRRLLRSVY